MAETAQQGGGPLRDLERGLASRQLGQNRAELEQGVVAGLGQRRVARCALRGQPEPEDSLLRHTNPVHPAPVVRERLPAALVEQEIAAHLVRMLFAQPAGADVAAGFLVGGEDQLQGARRGSPAFACQRRASHRLGRDLRLHIERAAPP
jgi:hypothetical protein